MSHTHIFRSQAANLFYADFFTLLLSFLLLCTRRVRRLHFLNVVPDDIFLLFIDLVLYWVSLLMLIYLIVSSSEDFQRRVCVTDYILFLL